jgi:hypothetical protein
MRLALDTKKTRIVVHTFAEGMFAKLAKDLEIELVARDGHVTIEDGKTRAEATFDVARARVTGVLHGKNVDEGALSEKDRADILHKMRDAIGGDGVVTISATTDDEKKAAFDVKLPRGASSARAPIDVTKSDGATEAREARGEVELSLSTLGVREVKGPLNAFRLSDRVRVIFRVTFAGE